MEKLERLQHILRDIGKGVVAFSGGCDSTLLLRVAYDTLGDDVVALTAISPSMAPWEREDAKRLCEQIGAKHVWVDSHEIERKEYRANPSNRCFYCKDELYSIALREAANMNLGVVMDGANLDDKGDHRPGRLAAKIHQVRSPLEEAELTKKEVREISKALGLASWDKPAIACLASRFPYGTEITRERIAKVTQCEGVLRDLGLRQFRARYHDTILRVEVAREEFDHVMQPHIRNELVERCKAEGFLYVTLDLQGFRSGSMNEVLSPEERITSSTQALPPTLVTE